MAPQLAAAWPRGQSHGPSQGGTCPHCSPWGPAALIPMATALSGADVQKFMLAAFRHHRRFFQSTLGWVWVFLLPDEETQPRRRGTSMSLL